MLLLYMTIAWACGIALSAAAPPPPSLLWVGLLLGGGLAAFRWRSSRRVRYIALCIASFGAALGRYQAVQPSFGPNHIIRVTDRSYVSFIGLVEAPPDLTESNRRLRVRVQQLQGLPASGVVQVYADRNQPIRYGDLVRVRGFPQTPPEFDTFSYRDYLARAEIYTVIYRAEVAVLNSDQGNPILDALFTLRDRSNTLINQLLPSPAAGFLAGILLGEESGISADINEAFRKTGTSHLIAISGANIAVVVGLLMTIFTRLVKRRHAVWFAIGGVCLYALFAGASGSVIRAAIMGSLALFAYRTGRVAEGLTATAAAFWFLVIVNPNWFFDAGLMLSTAGTMGLIVFAGPWARWGMALVEARIARPWLRGIVNALVEIIAIALAAQVAVLPLLLYYFRDYSLVSIAVNIAVAPVQPLIMTAGLVMLAAAHLWLPLGQVLAWVAYAPLTYTLAIIRGVAALPGISFPIELPLIGVLVYYVAVVGVINWASLRQDEARRLWLAIRPQLGRAVMIAAVSIGFAAVVAARQGQADGLLHVWFLDVSEGNAVLVRTPQGRTVLIDGGDNPTKLQTALGDRLPLNQRTIDTLILSQVRRATMEATIPLLNRYAVNEIVWNGQALPKDKTYQALLQTINAQQIPTRLVQRGDILTLEDGVTIEVLAPLTLPTTTSATDGALVLRLQYGGESVLICSRMSEKAVKALLDAETPLAATVLVLPANGTDKPNSEAFLKAVNPQVGIIFAEAGNRAAMPAEVVLNQRLRGVTVYRTDEHGTLELTLDGSSRQLVAARTPLIR